MQHPALQRLVNAGVGAVVAILLAHAAAAQPATAVVTIDRAWVDDCDDGPFNLPDLYWRVEIGDTVYVTDDDLFHTNVSPFGVGREFSAELDASAGSVPIQISLWDSDPGDDAHCDLQVGPGKTLDLVLEPGPCTIRGDLEGACGETLVSPNRIHFSIDVRRPPTALRCLHDPIWPQPGDEVTITAEALDDTLAPRTAHAIRIWVDDPTAPAASRTDASVLSTTTSPRVDSSFSYQCGVEHAGTEAVYTGFRTVWVGDPPPGRAVPVLYQGPPKSRVDIVFVPETNGCTAAACPNVGLSYTSSRDPVFLRDVHDSIKDGFLAGVTEFNANENFFLRNQHRFNFWIGLDAGDAEPGRPDPDDCFLSIENPDRYAFADAISVIHLFPSGWDSQDWRDCASRGTHLSSSPKPDSWPEAVVLLHEVGHAAFGLADEYCCDGGYFQTRNVPNVYESRTACESDAPSLGRTSADCTQIQHEITNATVPYWRSDPGRDDLMRGGVRDTPRDSDMRRMNWLFDRCAGADC